MKLRNKLSYTKEEKIEYSRNIKKIFNFVVETLRSF